MRPFLAIIAAAAASITLLAVLITAANAITTIGYNAKGTKPEIVSNEHWIPIDQFDSDFRTFIPGQFTHYSRSSGNGITRISLMPASFFPSFSLSPTIRSAFSGSFLTLRFADGASGWKYFIEQLSGEQRSFIEGRLGLFVEQNFGPDISFTYSVLPMLRKPSSLHLGYNSSGTLVFALEGIMNRSKTLEEKLEEFHNGFASTIPSIKITKRDLEGRFTARDVRASDEIVVSDSSKIDQWIIIQTHDGLEPSRSFITAQRGATFVISNDENALREILVQNVSITPPSVPSMTTPMRIMDGIVDTKKLHELLKGSPFEITSSGTILFSLEQRGEITTFAVK